MGCCIEERIDQQRWPPVTSSVVDVELTQPCRRLTITPWSEPRWSWRDALSASRGVRRRTGGTRLDRPPRPPPAGPPLTGAPDGGPRDQLDHQTGPLTTLAGTPQGCRADLARSE